MRRIPEMTSASSCFRLRYFFEKLFATQSRTSAAHTWLGYNEQLEQRLAGDSSREKWEKADTYLCSKVIMSPWPITISVG